MKHPTLAHIPSSRHVKLIAVIAVMGVFGLILQAITRAAPATVAIEIEQGAPAGNVSLLQDNSASASRAAKFMQTTQASSDKGPQSYGSLASARAALNAPADANYVMWNPAWPTDRDLEDVFATELGANDILVLPERTQPYVIDSSEGFRAAGVSAVTGENDKKLPVASRYKNQRNARTWFAMARAQRGILGLGPRAVIEISQSSWRQEAQVEDKGSVRPDGSVSPGRWWINTSGVRQSELVGSQEKVLEAASANSYFGNFTMKGRDLGGIAYSAISVGGTRATLEHLDLSGAWRGFSGVPNGETGAIGVNRATYLIDSVILGTRDTSGKRVGSSPIMINSSPGGTIQNTDPGQSVAGMMTIWNSSGKHYLKNVNARFNYGPGLNLEKLQAGFELEWTGGSIWSDYYGRGGKTAGKPSDQGDKGRMHFGIYAEGGSAKITLRDVDLDTGPTAGALNVQSYGNTKQIASDIKWIVGGQSKPVKAYGLN